MRPGIAKVAGWEGARLRHPASQRVQNVNSLSAFGAPTLSSPPDPAAYSGILIFAALHTARVRIDKTHSEHSESGVHLLADIGAASVCVAMGNEAT